MLGGTFYQAGGGKGANQAVAAARASREPVTLVAAVGDDAFGREHLERLSRENLRCEHVRTVPGEATGIALILVDAKGRNLISVASGANRSLRPEDIDALPESLFRSSRVFVTCLELPIETVRRALKRARQFGLTTVLNPAPADPAVVDDGLLRYVDVLTPNALEAIAVGSVAGDDMVESPLEGAEAVVRAHGGTVVVTLGDDGCAVVRAGSPPVLIPGRKVEAIDATAAGDAFTGALAVALEEGRSVAEAAAWANAAAAISVTRQGAQPSLPTREEIEAAFGRER